MATMAKYTYQISSRMEAASDVISGVAVDKVGADVRVKLCDSKSNRS